MWPVERKKKRLFSRSDGDLCSGKWQMHNSPLFLQQTSVAAPHHQAQAKENSIFHRTQVIEAEARISSEEFMWRIWTISQILGWLAYGSEANFRSLSEADLKGRTYLGLGYDQDFDAVNLEARLVDMLIHAGIRRNSRGTVR